MGKKRNSKKRKQEKAEKLSKKKETVSAAESETEMLSEEEEVVLSSEETTLLEEKEPEPTYEDLFSEWEGEEEAPKTEDIAAIREKFQRSLAAAGRRDLAGKRKIKIPFDRILSKTIWMGIMLALVGVIVWQAAEIFAAKIEYTRSNEFYIDLSIKFSPSKGDTGLTSMLYGENGLFDLPDYAEMKDGAVVIDKNTLSSEEKRELALINAKLAALKKQNSDTVGWIHIPGTNIDYPIVMPPAEDPEYYMDHSFSGANYSTGAIFIETRCRPGILLNKNTIIVGHNIRLQGMMFNQLVKFEQEDFFKEHSEVYIYTEEGKFVFNLFSFYKVDQEYNFRRVNFQNDEVYLQYLEAMRQNSYHQREGITFSADDRIITMYTCTNDNIKSNRYVAVAVLQDCLLNE